MPHSPDLLNIAMQTRSFALLPVANNERPIRSTVSPRPPTGRRDRQRILTRCRHLIPFRVVLANGNVAQHTGWPAFTLTFRTRRRAERRAVLGYIGLMESYFDGDA